MRVGELTEHAVEQAIRLGLSDSQRETQLLLNRMLEDSAPVTHPRGNRRYENWLFNVQGKLVISVHKIFCTQCDDRKRITVYDTCESCGGKKCKQCHWKGEARSSIPCMNCTGQKK